MPMDVNKFQQMRGLCSANQAEVPTAPPAHTVPQQAFEWEINVNKTDLLGKRSKKTFNLNSNE